MRRVQVAQAVHPKTVRDAFQEPISIKELV